MIKITNKVKCTGCGACNNCCPVNAINMKADLEGFLYPIVDKELCTNCNKCEKICPLIQLKRPDLDLEKCYAAYNKNDVERAKSSSGGIFFLVAKEVLRQGGIVFGAAFDEEFMVYHTKAVNMDELDKLVGSKYVQSRIGNTYRQIKQKLKDLQIVLFVGTSCQVGGLLAYLEKEYDNLICIDFICLGIPSPKVWHDYLKTYFITEQIEAINFKDKTLGWHTFSLRIIGNSSEFICNGRKTYFFTGYFKGLYSRISCSDCIYKIGNRVSDITISDCWGFSQIAPEIDDNRGLSSIICHSKKGVELFESIKNLVIWKEADINDVKKYNSNYCTSTQMGIDRQFFWKNYDKSNKKKLFIKYCSNDKDSLLKRLRRRVRRIAIRLSRTDKL